MRRTNIVCSNQWIYSLVSSWAFLLLHQHTPNYNLCLPKPQKNGTGNTYCKRIGKEDTLLSGSGIAVERVILPECCTANCAYVMPKTLRISGTISQVKNMHSK